MANVTLSATQLNSLLNTRPTNRDGSAPGFCNRVVCRALPSRTPLRKDTERQALSKTLCRAYFFRKCRKSIFSPSWKEPFGILLHRLRKLVKQNCADLACKCEEQWSIMVKPNNNPPLTMRSLLVSYCLKLFSRTGSQRDSLITSIVYIDLLWMFGNDGMRERKAVSMSC